jgi:hypothetical protein
VSKAAKIASNKGAPAIKVLRQCRITESFGRFVAVDIKPNGKRVSEGDTYERCRFLAGFRHGYAVVS